MPKNNSLLHKLLVKLLVCATILLQKMVWQSNVLCSSKCWLCLCLYHCIYTLPCTYLTDLIARYKWWLKTTTCCINFWLNCWCVLQYCFRNWFVYTIVLCYLPNLKFWAFATILPSDSKMRMGNQTLPQSFIPNTIQTCKQDKCHYFMKLTLFVRISK